MTVDMPPVQVQLDELREALTAEKRARQELEDLLNYLGINRGTTTVPWKYNADTDTITTPIGSVETTVIVGDPADWTDLTDGGDTTLHTHDLYATDTDLSNHTGDTSDAHDASAISVADSGGRFTGTDVEAVLAEVFDAVPSASATVKTPWVVSTTSLSSLGPMLAAEGIAAAASTAWPSANLAIYVPFFVTESITAKKLFVMTGATASGNIDVAIYDSAGTRQVSSGSTAQSGTSAIQEFDIADTALSAGLYYFGVAMDNTTGTVYRVAGAVGVADLKRWGVFQQAAAFALPASATFAAASQNFVPFVGMTQGTVV